MKVGGRRQLTIPADLAYGAAGLAARHRAQRDADLRRRPQEGPEGRLAGLTGAGDRRRGRPRALRDRRADRSTRASARGRSWRVLARGGRPGRPRRRRQRARALRPGRRAGGDRRRPPRHRLPGRHAAGAAARRAARCTARASATTASGSPRCCTSARRLARARRAGSTRSCSPRPSARRASATCAARGRCSTSTVRRVRGARGPRARHAPDRGHRLGAPARAASPRPAGTRGATAARRRAVHALCRRRRRRRGAAGDAHVNVGVIGGGTSINTIAARAADAEIDLRDADDAALEATRERVEAALRAAMPRGVDLDVEPIGRRPAGPTPRRPPARAGGARARAARPASTRPRRTPPRPTPTPRWAAGIPAICVGLTHGANAHRIDECVELGAAAGRPGRRRAPRRRARVGPRPRKMSRRWPHAADRGPPRCGRVNTGYVRL